MKIGDKYKRRYPSNESLNPICELREIHLEDEYVVLFGRNRRRRKGKLIYVEGEYETTLANLLCSYLKVEEKT